MNSVITEITDNSGGTVLYDAECAFCTAWARRAERVLQRRGFVFRPLPARTEEMKVVTASSDMLGGATAEVNAAPCRRVGELLLRRGPDAGASRRTNV